MKRIIGCFTTDLWQIAQAGGYRNLQNYLAGDDIDTIINVDGLGQLVINNQSLTTGSAFLSRDDSFGRIAA